MDHQQEAFIVEFIIMVIELLQLFFTNMNFRILNLWNNYKNYKFKKKNPMHVSN
jgi:hypothetical protein